jgi:FdhD protein
MSPPVVRAKPLKIAGTKRAAVERQVPEEVPVALVYDGSTHAVMMASPIDLADFAYGFSLTEGIVERRSEIASLDIVEHGPGIELRMWLAPERARKHAERRRAMIGPTGCGLCGIESLEGALAASQTVSSALGITAEDVRQAMEELRPLQVLNQMTGAVHGAAFARPGEGIVLIREDVGRHNALDKMAGALDASGIDPASGVVVLTSRVSVEMVQKAAAIGAPVISAISAPTALAVRTAEAAGITLVAVARRDSFEVFTHACRIIGGVERQDVEAAAFELF